MMCMLCMCGMLTTCTIFHVLNTGKALNRGETYNKTKRVHSYHTYDVHVVHVWYVNYVYNISCSKYRKSIHQNIHLLHACVVC